MNTYESQETPLPVRIAFTSETARTAYTDLRPATAASAGTDLRAILSEPEVTLGPGERFAVHTGVRVQPLQPGWAGFIYSRSGLGARDGLTVAQGVGVIDPDYTGELIVWLLNTSANERRIRFGERIAQLIFQPFAAPAFEICDDLAVTERGAGGFGHTGR